MCRGKTNRTCRSSPVEMGPSRISLRHDNFRMGHLLRRTAQFEEPANLKPTGSQNTMLWAAPRCKLPEDPERSDTKQAEQCRGGNSEDRKIRHEHMHGAVQRTAVALAFFISTPPR